MANFMGGLFKTALGVGVIILAYDFGRFEGVKTLIQGSLENGGTMEWDNAGKHVTMTVTEVEE